VEPGAGTTTSEEYSGSERASPGIFEQEGAAVGARRLINEIRARASPGQEFSK
jgi:hypothetical protein